MKNKKWILLILACILIVIGFVYVKKNKFNERLDKISELLNIGIYRENTFNIVPINSNSSVLNKTEYSYIDSIVYIGLTELGIDSVHVVIRQIDPYIQDNFDTNITLKAHIIGNNNQYILWVDKMSRTESITVISHELIHLKQYYTNNLIIEDNYIVWKNMAYTYDAISKIDYLHREWEIEAFKLERSLELKIRNILLKT
jgi:hypothetical protein